ncbi:MAG: toll/interleukin-1 receptor domain-containing protein [Bacteroidota bacterium]|nr:toll/interleukin-1 receptor domain-containing protein [Bacteroidota bacterium]
MKSIFIAYPSQDKSLAKKLSSKLEGKGYSCKILPRDHTDSAGNDVELEDIIADCSIFLMLYSDFAQQSDKLAEQLHWAYDYGLKIIPFKTAKLTNSLSSGFLLHKYEWLDAFGDGFDSAYEVLLEIIQEVNDGKSPERMIKQKISKKESVAPPNQKKYILIGIFILAVALIVYAISENFSNNKTNTESSTNTGQFTDPAGNSRTDFTDNADITTVKKGSRWLVGEWVVSDYFDDQKVSAGDKQMIKDAIVGKGKLIFNADKQFFRMGFAPQVQQADWSFDAIRSTIVLEVNNTVQEMKLSQYNDSAFVMLTTEQVTDSLGTVSPVTTKIVFSKVK